jgi:hypothetical protein
MATKKISEFTTLGSLSDSDILPVVNAGSNKKITGATLKTYAQSGLTIPTDVSDLTDTTSLLGSGTTLPANASGYLTNDGSGNLSWAAGDGTFSGNYTDLTNKPTIPTDVSDLTDTTSLLGGSGGVGTLDSVTDTGSTTTNSITVGSVSLTNGSTITETSTTTVITPPGALAGQSLVIRPTGVQGIVSDHPGGFTDGDTITLTVTPDYGSSQVTGTLDYTFTGATSIQLGRALTGTLTFNNESDKPITWTIPVSSTMTTFTVTISNASGFTITSVDTTLTLTTTGSSEDHHIHLIAGDPTITDIYLGDDDQYVKIEKNGGNVVIGTDTNTNQWTFGTDGDLVLPAGKTIRDTSGTDLLADVDTLLEPYKGFRAHYGTMYNNTDDENGPINKLVIYKSTATPSSVIDTSTETDDFQVTGLTGSDVVAMLVVVTDGTDWDVQTPTATLKTFVEKIIDEVILDEGVEGDVNTVSAMKSAFYNNFSNFGTVIPNPKVDLEFLSVNNQFSISPAFETGKGATFSGISYNMLDDTLDLGSWGQNAGTHQVGDVFVIPGNTIQDANSNFLATPDNDVTVAVTSAPDGYIGTFTVTGTLPRPAEIWPNSIDDGGDDEYDGGNAIHTNLATDISYNSGNVVLASSAFNGGDYVVTYQAGIFGIFATDADIDILGTSGDEGGYGNDSSSSGFDGDGIAVTGSLYGDSNEVNLGDFVFTGSTLTATDDDLYIKAVDDLWLDALQDDIHIRANDDVRIKVGYDFAEDSAQQEWRFDTSGYISFPDGSQQTTAYTGDYDDLTNKPTIPTSFSSLVNDVHTASLGTDGVLTLPEGGTIDNTPTIVTVTVDQFTDGGYPGTQVFTRVSDTLYQVLPSGPTMELISSIWYLKVGVSTYYDSTDLINWGNVAGSSPAPIGTLGILETMNLGVDDKVWTLDNNGNLTLPSGGTISEGGGLTGAIRLTPAGGTNEYQALVIYPTGTGDGDHIHLTAGGGTTDLYLGSDLQYVQIQHSGHVVVQAADGVDYSQWLFNKNGGLTFPDSTTQTTAYTGGGTTLPADASGYLVNDGSGALSWAAGDGTFSGDYNDLTNKPTIPADVSDLTDTTNLLFSGSYNDLSNTPALFDGDYTNLTNTPALFDGDYTSLANTPSLFSGDYDDLTSKPTLFSGSYTDLTSKPALFSGSYTDLTSKPALFSGSYTDLTDKPTIPTSFSSLVNGSFTASLDSNGELSLPTNAYTEAVIKELSATALVLFAQSTGGNIKLLAGATSAGSAKQWLFNGTDGKLTAPGNLQVDGGKIILNSAGNAYVESVDYGVNSANSAVNIFGGPYQKIKLRAGFGTEATWTFDTSGDLTAPRNIILNNPVTTVTTSVTGTVADSNGNPFTFRILKADNPQLITPFADPNFVLKWTGSDAGSVAAASQAPGGQGPSSLVSDDGTYWNFNSWFGLNTSRPNTGTVFTVEYGVVDSDTTISTTDTNLIIEADAKQYKFGTDGNITLPPGGDIVDSDNNSVIKIEAPFAIKTTGFDAFAGGRYGVNTTSNTVTATLPPSPATGDAIWFADAAGAYATNNLIINPGSNTIMSASGTMTVSTNDQSFGVFYNGTTWRVY